MLQGGLQAEKHHHNMKKINEITVIAGLILLTAIAGCGPSEEPGPPGPDSQAYRQAVSDFYVSLAASQTDEARFGFNKMNEVARAFPQEAAAWANLGVYAMRQGNFDLAGERLGQAREAAPGNADILYLSGMYESRRGNTEAAIDFYRQASNVDNQNLRMLFSLMNELEREDDRANAEEIREVLRRMMSLAPANQAVQYEAARLGAIDRDEVLLVRALDELETHTGTWPDDAREQLELLRQMADESSFSDFGFELVFLRNMIEETPQFQYDLLRIQFPPTEVGFLITRFLWLPEPVVQVAEPDLEMRFSAQQPEDIDRSSLLKSVTLLEELPPFTVHIADGELVIDADTRLGFPGRTDGPLSPRAIAEIDYNYNFRNDIALAGNLGFRLYRQEEDQSFTNVTADLGIPASLREQSYNGVWPADVDLDGDLDLILAPYGGTPLVLINQADGRFGTLNPFEGIENVADVLWADFDSDGAADAVFLTREGEVALYRNMRSGEFVREAGLPELDNVAAVASGDITANGYFEILAARTDGSVAKLAYNQRHDNWEKSVLIPAGADREGFIKNETTFFIADLDNNGSFDLVLSGFGNTQIWLSDTDGAFTLLETEPFGRVTSVYDVDGNERLDLIGSNREGQAFEWMNTGTKPYFAYSIRARASGLEGDQRINSFGIGGEMEIRSGLLYQKQVINSPILHFGLGEYEEAEMLRIIWPNGSVQAEFAELGMGSTIFNEQVLKGSCPWLFTNDGEQIQFITDALWRAPLGLRINALETAGVTQTLDRVRIPSGLLRETDGIYDVRITAELWETHFFDYVGLVAVDHPEDTEMFIDERFVFPAPDLSARLLSKPKPVAKVTDKHGNDLTQTLSQPDADYVAPFRKTSFQGLVHPHYIEIEIGDDAPWESPLWLVLQGWLRPTDSSINMALGQGRHQPPSGIHVEVSDGEGGWQTLHENYGVPAGKLKSILLDLTDAFPHTDDRRVRLHTTSEIYWDAVRWAEERSASEMIKTELTAGLMELRYRGFSEWSIADSTSPNLPDYSHISSSNQRWRDLIGYHTRFGDVTELLSEIDDRYVIMNAGDEMVFEFTSPGEPKDGMQRSFIFVSDGWVKDGDYNTEASKTVLPLPYHGQKDYDYNRRIRLHEDPVYLRFPEDWVNYHTRFITPESFRTALKFDE